MLIFLRWLEVIALLFGAWVGYQALNEYKNQSKIAVINRLDDADSRLYERQYASPLTASLYADIDVNMLPRAQADTYLAIAAGCKSPDDKDCFKKNGAIPEWKTIPQLECRIWGVKDFKNLTNQKLREGTNFADQILYLVARAFESKGVIKEEYEYWAAYITNYGHHPLMLSSIRHGITNGYLSTKFVEELKLLLSEKNSPRAAKVIAEIYPEFVREQARNLKGFNGC